MDEGLTPDNSIDVVGAKKPLNARDARRTAASKSQMHLCLFGICSGEITPSEANETNETRETCETNETNQSCQPSKEQEEPLEVIALGLDDDVVCNLKQAVEIKTNEHKCEFKVTVKIPLYRGGTFCSAAPPCRQKK